MVGFGKDSPELWLSVDESKIGGQPHVGLKVNNQEEVQAFYHKAISLGAKDNGAPGLRPEYGPTYYAAFVITPDGHNLEALIK